MVNFFLGLLVLIAFLTPKIIFAHSQTQVVEMTPNGFEPQTVTVDENSTVLFVNQDKVAHWPASNVHPTHDIYPEFDPQKPIEPGNSWSFKPKKVGEWKYHDHLFPHIRGTIIVIGEESTNVVRPPGGLAWLDQIRTVILSTVKKLIRSLGLRLQDDKRNMPSSDFIKLPPAQQTKEIESIAKNTDPGIAWEYLKETFKAQGGSSGNIHDLAHLAGGLIFEINGFEGLGKCSQEFAFGCYHGFLDKAFAKNLDRLLDAQNACLKLGPENSGPVASCIHGIGHGVASFHSTADLKASLSSCRKLTSGREYCFDGVFMEFVRSAPGSFFKADDPLYPCDSLEKEFGYVYSLACGRNQPSLLMGRFKLGFDEVVPICLNSDSKPFKEACFDALGFSLASTGDVEKIIAGCQKIADAQFTGRCIKAAAGELVFQEVPNWYENSQAVCNAMEDDKQDCLANLQRLIKEYDKKIKINFPKKSSSEDLDSYIRSQMRKCYESDGKDGCYKEIAKVFYDQFGLAQTLQTFRLNEGYPEVYARCHEVTHYLSRFEYDKQKNIAKVYAICDSTCHGGCYHGTLEAYLKENSNTDFAKICGKMTDYQKPIEFNECLHGLGHAAMFVTEMELRQSLNFCDRLSEVSYRERCYSGAFMENSSSSTSSDHASIYLKKDDPFYPCNNLEEKYLSLCWQYQSSYFSLINKQDWVKVSNMCLQIPSQYQDRCFKTIGTNQVGFTPSLPTMKQDCDLMPTEHFKDICVTGVVSSLSYRFVGDVQRMVDFCALVDLQNKESCFKQMGTGLLDWDKNTDMAKKECGKIPDPKGSVWCMSVI